MKCRMLKLAMQDDFYLSVFVCLNKIKNKSWSRKHVGMGLDSFRSPNHKNSSWFWADKASHDLYKLLKLKENQNKILSLTLFVILLYYWMDLKPSGTSEGWILAPAKYFQLRSAHHWGGNCMDHFITPEGRKRTSGWKLYIGLGQNSK